MRKYFRVSLLLVILLMVVSAIWASYFGQRKLVLDLFEKVELVEREKEQLSEDLTIARSEAQRLRVELGYFEVEDNSLVHALKLSTSNDAELRWEYRVYIPEAKRYYVACQVNDLPTDQSIPQLEPQISQSPSQSEIKRISSDGYLVTTPVGHAKIKVALEKQDERFKLLIKIERGEANGGTAAGSELSRYSLDKWPYQSRRSMSETGVQRNLVTQKAPLLLLDRRMFGADVANSDEATEGIMLWIDSYE